MINNLEHIALSVADMERSIAFYRDILDMKVVFETEFLDGRMERITGIPGARCRVVHLQLGSGTLELFQYTNPVIGKNTCGKFQNDHGFTHIGFRVTNIQNHVRRLKERGVEFLGELTEIRPGAWIVYFKGPDGEVCEFRQLPDND